MLTPVDPLNASFEQDGPSLEFLDDSPVSLVCFPEAFEQTLELERELALAEKERDDAIQAHLRVERQRANAVMLGLQIADQRDAIALERDGLVDLVEELREQVVALLHDNRRLRSPAADSVCVDPSEGESSSSVDARPSVSLGNFRSALH
jgi:hypothetical protein